MSRLSAIPKEERPRERLQAKGAQALADYELMAILLGSGTKGHDVLSVAKRVVEVVDTSNGKPGLEDLGQIPGVGFAKATLIAAALEFSRRRIRAEGLRISFPPDVLPLIKHYADRKQEHFLCITLNGAKEVIATRVVSMGLVDKAQVHPREVFAEAITDRACAVIVAHNHPSGSLVPSKEDKAITNILKSAGLILGIDLLDHIIFSHKGYYSFLEHGDLQ
jgi:DNA repair protein RadC